MLVLTMWSAVGQETPGQTARFSISVRAVQVDVYVGRKNKAILGLTADDFELFDNGVRQQVQLVDRHAAPLSLALVVDTSDSLYGQRLVHLKSAAHAFLDGLETQDRASLITFTQRIEERVALTSDHRALHDAIDAIETGGATVWHDALFAGLKTVEAVSERAIVLLFTDGQDTYSWLRPEQLMPLVEQSNAVVYGVVRQARTELTVNTTTSAWRRAWRRRLMEHSTHTRLLRNLTEASGGDLIETSSTAELKKIFLSVLAEMKTRYLLTYHPTSTERGWHAVEVKLKGQKADIRARRGYFYENRAR